MDWDRLITVEQMEAATNELLETGKKVGADSWQQRVKNQTPHCGFGEAGTCCRICSMGPCRITPKAHWRTEEWTGALTMRTPRPLLHHAEGPARHLRLRRARHCRP